MKQILITLINGAIIIHGTINAAQEPTQNFPKQESAEVAEIIRQAARIQESVPSQTKTIAEELADIQRAAPAGKFPSQLDQYSQYIKNRAMNPTRPALHIAAAQGDLATMDALIKAGDINQKTKSGKTALYFATLKGCGASVDFLLANQAKIDMANDNVPLLHLAVSFHEPKIAEALIKSGADVNQCHGNDWCPLDSAIQNKHFPLIQLLLANGARIGVYPQQRKKLLMSALEHPSCPELHTLLLSLFPKINNLVDAVSFAIENRHSSQVQPLIELLATNNIGLHHACNFSTISADHELLEQQHENPKPLHILARKAYHQHFLIKFMPPRCPICYIDKEDIIGEHKTIALGACGHIYCKECIDLLLSQKNQCPICLKPLK